MRKVVEFFVKFPIWANAILLTFVLFGAMAWMVELKKSFFPEIEPSVINVNVVLPGAAPEEMEEGVTIKIEEAIRSIEGIDEVTSNSSENLSAVTIKLFKDYDPDEVLMEVKNAIDRINSFPVSAERPVVSKARPRSRGVNMAVFGDVDLKILKQFAEKIEDDLLSSGVISQVLINGYPELEISIEVPEATLSRYGLTFSQVAAAVRNNNRDISAGSIKARDEEILIRSRAKEKIADKIGDIVLLANTDGSKVFLRDIATVREQFSDTPDEVYINGKRGVFMEVTKLPEEDLQQISEYVQAYTQTFNQSNDAVQLEIIFDSMMMLEQRLNMLLSNGIVGLILVVITLGVFLNIRLSFWVALGIPISFFGMFLVTSLIGITINMLSLFGMILVVGILVDDGIVIAENIFAHLEQGKSPIKAAIDGTMEVMGAVFTSVLTTVMAFVPLLMLESFEFLVEMAIVVMTCLLLSLIEAFFVLPAHLVIKEKSKPSRFRQVVNGGVDFLRYRVYGTMLEHILNWRYVYVAMPVVFVMIVLGLMKGDMIRSVFFPNVPFDQFEVNIAFTPGTREDKVIAYLKRFDSLTWVLNDQLKAEFADSVDYIGVTATVLGSTSGGIGETGSHAGHVRILPKDMDNREHISTFEISNRLAKLIGPIPEAEKFQVGGSNRFGKPVSLSLLSNDAQQLEQAKEDLKAELEKYPNLKNVADNNKVGRRELQIELLPQAYFLGLDHNTITQQIRQGFFGEEVQRLQKGTDEVRVWVRYPESDRKSLGQLEEMKIRSANGKAYPLSELITYSSERGLVNIRHYDGKREVVVDADFKDPNDSPQGILDALEADFFPAFLAKYPSIEIRQGGQAQRSQKSFASFQRIFPPIIFTIILLLSLTFRSLSQALMIMLMIPVGIFCGIFGHGVESVIGSIPRPVSLLSLWGMLALGGVIINDAVVFLEKFNINLRNGKSVREATMEAGISRFRPILLTSITTVAGLYPLIKETSFQAQFLIPMAISVAYGVLFGTFFILTCFPALIMVVNDLRRMIAYLLRISFAEADRFGGMGHLLSELVNEYKVFLPLTFLPVFVAWLFFFILALVSGSFRDVSYPLGVEVEPSVRERARLKEIAG
ncbi:MAG: efflux RND transporter permease subunit [Bernardetiaceae bacterium]